MAKEYKNIKIYLDDGENDVVTIPFMPEELEIKFDGNNATEYLANGDFFTAKKKPQPKEIEISCFFPSDKSMVEVNKGITDRDLEPIDWVQYFYDAMDDQRTIELTFTKWDFTFLCTVEKFYPKITYAEIDDIYYSVVFKESKDPVISPVLTLWAQGHNSWITAGEWQLVGNVYASAVVDTITGGTSTSSTTSNATTENATTTKGTQDKTSNDIVLGSKVRIKQTKSINSTYDIAMEGSFYKGKFSDWQNEKGKKAYNTYGQDITMQNFVSYLQSELIVGTVSQTYTNADGKSYVRVFVSYNTPSNINKKYGFIEDKTHYYYYAQTYMLELVK